MNRNSRNSQEGNAKAGHQSKPWYKYIDSNESMIEACKIISETRTIAVDLECENNMHHYGVYISLIQVTSRFDTFLFDIIELKKKGGIKELLDILKDIKIQKIFHDVNFDFRILYSEFACQPKNLFDTQIAAKLLGYENLGLTSLLDTHFGIKKDRKFQKADWGRRPLSRDLLEYAAKDTRYLYKLRKIMIEQLENKGRYEWFKQECRYIEEHPHEYKEPSFWDLKGVGKLDDRTRAIALALYNEREKIAKRFNRPIHFIMNNRNMFQIAQDRLTDIKKWKDLKNIHPYVKKNPEVFIDAIKRNLDSELRMPPQERKFFSKQQRDLNESLREQLQKIAVGLGIDKMMIMSNEQILDTVITGKLDSLRPWQKELLERDEVKYR